MLIRFTVENFLSFKDEVEFSMVPGRARKHKEHVYRDEQRKDIRLLKTGVIYGPNAAGKTNLIKAMNFAQNLIVAGRRPNQGMGIIPFLLDRSTESGQAKFLFEIKVGKKAYAYFMELDAKQVCSESLVEIRPASEKKMFERRTDKQGNTKISFGSAIANHKQEEMFWEHIARGTRPNQLFLTETVERNIKLFQNVYDWFQNSLVLIYPYTGPSAAIGPIYLNNENGFQSKFDDLVQLFDLDIEKINLSRIEIDPDSIFNEDDKLEISKFIGELNDDSFERMTLYSPRFRLFAFIDKNNQFEFYRFTTVHRVRHENREVQFDLEMESDGTTRLFELTPAMIRMLSATNDIVFFIDELDRSLHPHMSQNLLDIFLSNSVGKPSQFVVTTHESDLLDLDLLRRDEIWILEKDRFSASQLFSLEEYAPRYDVDVKRGYLFGRYGGIPILPSYNTLDWAK